MWQIANLPSSATAATSDVKHTCSTSLCLRDRMSRLQQPSICLWRWARLTQQRSWRCPSDMHGLRGSLQGRHQGPPRFWACSTLSDRSNHGAAGSASSTLPRVCILGGGFGGLYTAVRLESLVWPQGTRPQITLVDQSERFVFKPLLYELLNGGARPEEVAPPFRELLEPYATTFTQGSVQAVELDTDGMGGEGSASGGRVVLRGGAEIGFDWLVVALGSAPSTFGIPGVKEHAIPFCTYDDVLRIEERVAALSAAPGAGRVVVVGAGYAGVELATTLSERLAGAAAVRIVDAGDTILAGAPEGQRAVAQRSLDAAGIPVTHNAMVSRIEASSSGAPSGQCTVHLNLPAEKKQAVVADLVLWTAGSGPATRAGGPPPALPFAADGRGALRTDATLRCVDHPRVFALGDVAGPAAHQSNGGRLPVTAQVAFQQADYVAWNLWAAINRRPLLAFKYQHLGDMMSLGRAAGAVSLPLGVPPALSQALQTGPLGPLLSAAGIRLETQGQQAAEGRVTLEGPLAGALRRAAYWYRQPTQEMRLKVGTSWLQQALTEGADAARKATSGASRFGR